MSDNDPLSDTHEAATSAPSTELVSTPGELASLIKKVVAFSASAASGATVRAYRADLATFTRWCHQQGLDALPAEPETVALYLTSLAQQGRKVTTIERALAGIGAAHRAAGHPWLTLPALRTLLRGIRRELGKPAHKKRPIGHEDLLRLVGVLKSDLCGLRDRALILVGWFGALRRSELAALDVGDVKFTADGFELTVRRSKTDPFGQGLTKGVPYASDPRLCPVRALRAWLEASHIETGALFRAARGGTVGDVALNDKTIARVVKRTASVAGLDASELSGHSLRAGFVTTAAKKGKSLDAIMRQTGHRSERIARGYIRHASLFVDNAATGLI